VSEATRLVELALRHFELTHDRAGACHATTLVLPRDTFRIGDGAFRRSLALAYYRERDTSPSEGSFGSARATIEGLALYEGEEHQVYLRVGGADGLLYLDLGDDLRRAVEIAPDGWRITDDPLVRFLRPPGMTELPEPVAGGTLWDLHPFLNLSDEHSFRLVVGFLLSALHPTGPYPHLSLVGEQGSAKSTAAAILRALIDPNAAALRSPPSEARDLAVATRGSWVLAFDNVSRIPAELADALCRLSTGGAFATRRLYTDDEEVTFEARRPVILTSIPEVVTTSDLASRTFTVLCPAIPDEDRRAEADLWADFEEARPRLMGALCDAAACALGNLGRTKLDALPRMAEVARWVTAAEPALGWEPGSFLAALDATRTDAAGAALEGSAVAAYLVALAEGEGFTGTASDLLKRIEGDAGPEAARSRFFPRNARALSGQVRRLAPDLSRLGVSLSFVRSGHDGQRTIRIYGKAAATAAEAEVLPFAKPAPGQVRAVRQAVEALRAIGAEESWGVAKLASLALAKAAGRVEVAVQALNSMELAAPDGSPWTIDMLRGVL